MLASYIVHVVRQSACLAEVPAMLAASSMAAEQRDFESLRGGATISTDNNYTRSYASSEREY